MSICKRNTQNNSFMDVVGRTSSLREISTNHRHQQPQLHLILTPLADVTGQTASLYCTQLALNLT